MRTLNFFDLKSDYPNLIDIPFTLKQKLSKEGMLDMFVSGSFTLKGEEITAEVTIVLDADDVTVPLQQAENLVDSLLGDEYTIESKGKIF